MQHDFEEHQKNIELTLEDYQGMLGAIDHSALLSLTDAKGNILYVNDKFLEVSKYDLDDLIGQNHRILKSDHQPQEVFVELWKTISSGKVWRGDIKNRAKDGTYYWVDSSIAPILDKEGKPSRYVAIRFPITDRKREDVLLRPCRDTQVHQRVGQGGHVGPEVQRSRGNESYTALGDDHESRDADNVQGHVGGHR